MFYSNDVVGSKMVREMLPFTMETAAVGCEGRICETAAAGYVRAMSAVVRIATVVQSTRSGKQCAEYYWGMQLQIARRFITVVSRWSWVAMGGALLLGNATDDVVKNKMAREMLCFTMETAAVGCQGSICETAVAGYVRPMFALCPE